MADKKNQKLELTWIGKDKRPRLEPRVLVEDAAKSHYAATRRRDGKDIFDNMLIHGDNLLALKALEQEFAGRVKCIYIDPPYNTGNAFEHYDDGIEHSIWLGLMRERLVLLQSLMRNDGLIFIQIDDREMAYLKVMTDEIFGRENHLSTITVKVKAPAGVGQESFLFDVNEYILVYAKNLPEVKVNVLKERTSLAENTYTQYSKLIHDISGGEYVMDLHSDKIGNIPLIKHNSYTIESIQKSDRNEGFYKENVRSIIRTTNPQGGLIKKLLPQIPAEGLYSITYKPTKGNKKDSGITYYFLNGALIVWLNDSAVIEGGHILKLSKMTNLWLDNFFQGIAAEGSVTFLNSKKPEALIKRILSIATNPGDLVLDSFLGSGTTAAVAHKMGRRWIGVELGDHCYTHCKVRLDKVIDGTDAGGITKAVDWKGGGGYRFYELAPTLIKKDRWGQMVINPEYNAERLAEAVCKLEGFTYAPSESEYFIHGKSTERDYIYVTTNYLKAEHLHALSELVGPERTLLICCKGFATGVKHPNLTVKKIPKVVLDKCEYGHDDYSLNVKNLPMAEPTVEQGELFN